MKNIRKTIIIENKILLNLLIKKNIIYKKNFL